MNKKLIGQLAILAGVAALFVVFDIAFYSSFTKQYKSDNAKLMQEKSIELDKYLPFDDNSLIVKLDSQTKLDGELPVLDGATALFPLYSAFMNATYPQGSSSFTGEDFTTDSKLQKTGTTGAYKAVVDKTADVIFVAQPSDGQKKYAEENGAELIYVPIGSEAFVFITNAANSIEALTVEQVKGIYTGQYTNWSEVGGENINIIALQRNENSGSQTAMLAFMGETKLMNAITYNNIYGRSIGYSFRYYVEGIVANEKVKTIALNGVKPTVENIRCGEYPIVDNFYAVYRADNCDLTCII